MGIDVTITKWRNDPLDDLLAHYTRRIDSPSYHTRLRMLVQKLTSAIWEVGESSADKSHDEDFPSHLSVEPFLGLRCPGY